MAKEKRNVLTGGIILITLGILIFLSKSGTYSFTHTWPVLLIVVGICTLIQRIQDIGGWFITIVGVAFLITEFYGYELYKYSQYILPAVLILIGIYVLVRRRKNKV